MVDKKYGLATSYSDGLMSAADKTKLDNITPGGGGDMLKSVYDTNDDGVVDSASAVQLQNTANNIRFGIDGNGNYGYYKVGADTVTPFKVAESETVLWSNPYGDTMANTSPFSAQQITLSESAANYDRIRVYYKSIANPSSGTAVLGVTDYFLDNISRMSSALWDIAITIGDSATNNYPYARCMYFTNSSYNVLQVTACYVSSQQINERCVPLKVCGIKV